VAVVRAAVQDKVATRQPADLVQAVQDTMWQPVYGPLSEKEASP
jgi:malate dehydrogenase (oxaloacetate-decarboxylating)